MLVSIITFLFGILNLTFWKLLKYDSIIIKARLIAKAFCPYNARIYGGKIFYVEYNINNKCYKTSIMVFKSSLLYNGEIGNSYDIYVSKNYPKLIIDNTNKLTINFIIGIISILFSIFLTIYQNFF